MKNFFLYPTLNDKIKDSLSYSISKPIFMFTNEIGDKEEIFIGDQENEEILLVDESGNWDIQYQDLIIKQTLMIENPSKLFGDNGVASKDSTLGVSVKWSSKESKVRRAKKIGSINYGDKNLLFEISSYIEQGVLRKSMKYSIDIFLEIPGSIVSIFAVNSGTLLGSLYDKKIILDGDRSLFPIISINDEKSPLWSLNADWSDVNDMFEDSVRLVLNESHKDYKYLDMTDKNFNEGLFEEILISVIVQIIITAKEKNDIDYILDDVDLENGSIGSLIRYYIETYSIEYSSVSHIFSTVVKGVRK